MTEQAMIEGRTALIVFDIQKGTFLAPGDNTDRAIPHMPDYAARMLKSRDLVDTARSRGTPVIFIREAHRPDLVDLGRELDGAEDVHCVEGQPGTPLAVEETGIWSDDYTVKKRRYSAFFGNDLEILLKGVNADTLILSGGLTDVCMHYTFMDAHQNNYVTRVVEDCVAGWSNAAHEASLRAMEYLQTGARRSLDQILAAMRATQKDMLHGAA